MRMFVLTMIFFFWFIFMATLIHIYDNEHSIAEALAIVLCFPVALIFGYLIERTAVDESKQQRLQRQRMDNNTSQTKAGN